MSAVLWRVWAEVVDRTDPERGRFSFDELSARVEATTRGMLAAGVAPGDAVAIWAPNCWEWVVALLALQSAGGVLVPLNTRYKGREAADILRRSRAAAPGAGKRQRPGFGNRE